MTPLAWLFGLAGLVFLDVRMMPTIATLHSTLQTRGTDLVPTARGKSFSLFALAFFFGGSGGTAVFGRLRDNGFMALAVAICGIGLGAVGELVTGVKPMERAR